MHILNNAIVPGSLSNMLSIDFNRLLDTVKLKFFAEFLIQHRPTGNSTMWGISDAST